MKRHYKIILAAFFLLSSGLLFAQQSRPDTVYWGDPCYLFPDTFEINVGPIVGPNGENTIGYVHFYRIGANPNIVHAYLLFLPGQDLSIHGIAVPMEASPLWEFPPLTDTLIHMTAPRAYLFQCDSGQWGIVDSVLLSANIPHRHLSATGYYQGQEVSQTVSVYEFFFASPHIVHDTFAVGYGFNNADPNEGFRNLFDSTKWIEPLGTNSAYHVYRPLHYSIFNPYRNNVFSVATTSTIANHSFPILESAPEGYEVYTAPTHEDVECIQCRTAPRELRLALLQDSNATLQWSAGEESPDVWELKVASDNEDSARFIRTEYIQHRLEDLAPGNYSVAVRGACYRNCGWYGERTTFSDWSNTVSFRIVRPLPPPPPEDTTVTAIGTPTLPQVSVAPNPAGEFVDISSDCPVQQVVLRDATGKAVLRQAFAETSVRISLATVPAGLYVAEISTARGTVSRKLIVE